jgi:argininosuccinate lyase
VEPRGSPCAALRVSRVAAGRKRLTLWTIRVSGELAEEAWEFLRADDEDLLPYDWAATFQHARRLHHAGILDDAELHEVSTKLAELEPIAPEDEDVHSAIERQLGDVGRKIHAGRSRNDQVAAALRIYVQVACDEARHAVRNFCGLLLDRADAEAETPMPGYTHLQRALPVTVGHHLLAWVEMLERDLARFAAADLAARPSPLGAGALAGSTLPLPPPDGEQARNSLDAVADRDFALDYLYACTMLFTHLSRIGEELVLWATSEFGFVKLPDSAATGSSMMPQKLNPDVAELVRGKAGTMVGRLTGLLTVVKGLPLAYNRDLQEDKPPVFAARRDVALALAALAVLVEGIAFDPVRLAEACRDPLLRATDKAEDLVREGVPFRDAHEHVAAEVLAGTFEPPKESLPRLEPGPADVRAAAGEARKRLGL